MANLIHILGGTVNVSVHVNLIYMFIELKSQLSDFWPCPVFLSTRALGGEACICVVYEMSWEQRSDGVLRSSG